MTADSANVCLSPLKCCVKMSGSITLLFVVLHMCEAVVSGSCIPSTHRVRSIPRQIKHDTVFLVAFLKRFVVVVADFSDDADDDFLCMHL